MREQKEIPGESFLKKSIMYCMLARYVIVENSDSGGQMLELSKVLGLGCVVAVLQQRGKGSTWLLEGEPEQNLNARKFLYEPEKFEEAVSEAIDWCEARTQDRVRTYAKLYEELPLDYVADIGKEADASAEESADMDR